MNKATAFPTPCAWDKLLTKTDKVFCLQQANDLGSTINKPVNIVSQNEMCALEGLHWKLMADLLIQKQGQLHIRHSTRCYTSVQSPNPPQSIWISAQKDAGQMTNACP